MEPTSVTNIHPGICTCGALVDPKRIHPFHTHQVIELSKIEIDIQHFILNQGVCTNCGGTVKSQMPKDRQTGYGPRLSALIAEISGIQGKKGVEIDI